MALAGIVKMSNGNGHDPWWVRAVNIGGVALLVLIGLGVVMLKSGYWLAGQWEFVRDHAIMPAVERHLMLVETLDEQARRNATALESITKDIHIRAEADKRILDAINDEKSERSKIVDEMIEAIRAIKPPPANTDGG